MSIRGMMWHYFNVVKPINNQLADGSIQRDAGWLPLYSDVLANIQGISKEDVLVKYHIINRTAGYVFFHDSDLQIFPDCRFYTAGHFADRITDPSADNIRIFEFRGIRTPVTFTNKMKRLSEIYVEETFIRDLE